MRFSRSAGGVGVSAGTLGDFWAFTGLALTAEESFNRKEREENRAKDAKKIALAPAARVFPWDAEVGNSEVII